MNQNEYAQDLGHAESALRMQIIIREWSFLKVAQKIPLFDQAAQKTNTKKKKKELKNKGEIEALEGAWRERGKVR